METFEMKNIHAENVNFTYIKSNDVNVNLELFKGGTFLRSGVPPELINYLMNSSYSRLSLFQSILSPNTMIPYVLAWQSEKDLELLDTNVENGKYKEEDFSDSIRCYPHRTICFSCGTVYLTLNVDAADPYPCKGGGVLLDEKIKKMKFYSCEKCNSSLRQLVVKIIKQC